MASHALLAVLIVNYNTSKITRSCVTSLRAQRLVWPDGTPAPFDIVVIDNNSHPEERDALVGIDAQVIYNRDNRGYGTALNQATVVTNSEFVLFSNSDTWYFPGALQTLIDAFRRFPHCGAVGPRLWWDRERSFLIPPIDPVTLGGYLQDIGGRLWPWWQRRREQRWVREAVRFWQAWEALRRPMLSGCCILTCRAVLSACGGFDEQFHLYYEDTDWCRRVRQKGYQLYCVPAAHVTHLHNQSGRQEAAAAQQRGRESETRYFHKHYGVWLWTAVSAVATQLLQRRTQSDQLREYIDLGICRDPPQFSLSAEQVTGYLWQLSPVPSCMPAIGRFLSAPQDLSLSIEVWAQLEEGDFFARLFSLPEVRLLQQWRWQKVSP